ncbi:MAG TPA: DNA repair protein RecO, partial [Patescibacteria group bacterium]
ASGIRRIPSRRSPHVELLNHAALTLYNSHGFFILTEAATLDNFAGVKEDLQKIGLAYHLCELVDGLCPENQENPAVFNLLKVTLTRLSLTDDIHKLVNNFQAELLQLLGFWNNQEFLTERVDPDLIGVDLDNFVENILERKLKSKAIFTKLQ